MVLLYLTSTGSLMLGTLAQLVTFVVLARGLGVDQFGQLMAITAATTVGLQVCGLGAGEAMVRRVARAPEDYPDILGHNIVLTLASGVILVMALALGLHLFMPVADDWRTNLAVMLAFTLSNVLLYRWILLAEQIFIGHWRIARANIVNAGFAIARALTAAAACMIFGVESLTGWAAWYCGLHVLAALLCAVAVVPFGAPRWRIVRPEIRLGIHFVTPWFFWSLRQNIDLLVLSAVASPAVVGSFSVVKRIIEASLLSVTSLNRLLYPKLSRAGKEGPRAALKLTMDYLAAMLALAAITSAALYLVAPWVPVLFGEQFGPAVQGTRILCWAIVVTCLSRAAFEALGAAERHGIRAAVYNGCSVVGAGLIGAMTYAYLLPGTFVAIYVAETLMAVGLWVTLVLLSRGGATAANATAALGGPVAK